MIEGGMNLTACIRYKRQKFGLYVCFNIISQQYFLIVMNFNQIQPDWMDYNDIDQSFDQFNGNYQFSIRVQPDHSEQLLINQNFGGLQMKPSSYNNKNIFQGQMPSPLNVQNFHIDHAFNNKQDNSGSCFEAEESQHLHAKAQKLKKPKKNQYDKNIFANITAVVIKKILSSQSQAKLQLYCQHQQYSFKTFHAYFLQLQRKKTRLGTTEMAKFYSNPEIQDNLKKVFSMFLINFLREKQGKMSNKQKYLRCATKMMYIPQLQQSDFIFLNNEKSQI